jgi:hypothetical protein
MANDMNTDDLAETNYEDNDASEVSLAEFDLDAAMEGVQARAEYTDPIVGNHIFYVRTHWKLDTQDWEDEDSGKQGTEIVARHTMEVLATESEKASEAVGGLFVETFTVGGKLRDFAKYKATKRLPDSKENFLARLLAFKPAPELTRQQALDSLNERYEDTEASGVCAKVRITARESKPNAAGNQFINIKKVKVIDPSFPLVGSDGEGIFENEEELEAWHFWTPRQDSKDEGSDD